MNWRINIMVLVLFISACKHEKTNDIVEDVKTKYLIEANELKAVAHQPNIKIIDFRKKEIYEKEHIVGALNL